MKNIAKFINKAQERRFNDALMNIVITEIQLKSGNLNDEMILPRYYNKGIFYEGEFFEQAAMIKDLVPFKALIELKMLIEIGSNLHFENKQQIKNWIARETGITDCSLSVSF